MATVRVRRSTRNELRRLREIIDWMLLQFKCKCFFCREEISDAAEATIHHEDFDRSNNSAGNLKISHRACHKRFHILITIKEGRMKRKER